MLTLEQERQLMLRVSQREQHALAELYRVYATTVYHLAFHILQNASAAEEITQDVFFHLWTAPHQWDADKGRLQHWLLAVTRNAAIDRVRHENRHADSLPMLPTLHHESESEALPNDDNDLLRQLIAQLPHDDAHVIHLTYYMGMSPDETAQHLHTTPAAVRSRLKNALKRLRTLWQGQHTREG
jgi:RNA polymerase sigma-70 factor (ECF subfamily)